MKRDEVNLSCSPALETAGAHEDTTQVHVVPERPQVEGREQDHPVHPH